MAFTMRGSSSKTERPGWPWRVWLVAAVLLLGACSAENQNQRFEIRDLRADWASGRMDVHLQQRLELGPEAREALLHGVPLTLGVEVVLAELVVELVLVVVLEKLKPSRIRNAYS